MKTPCFACRVVSVLVLLSMLIGPLPTYASTPSQATLLAVPGMPEPTTLDPTQMADVEPAHPGASVNLIQPPQANNLGDARLSYPIEVPPGRLGMQPELVVDYDSSRGNSWLGLGWDLSLPAITIDTRWGVPRYLPDKESETYLLNGEQLTPLAHRTDEFKGRVGDEKVFHTRAEGEFQRIIRHGTGPGNYWWEITDKDGTTYYYGADPNARALASQSVLTDNAGYIFVWALSEIRDSHGNNVQYRYERVFDTGLPATREAVDCAVKFGEDLRCGHTLYPKEITYTGYGEQAGPYIVEFVREGGRPDVVIDARGGFKQVTAERLREINIYYVDGSSQDLIRGYRFGYQVGAFEKTLLGSITQVGESTAEFHTHTFDYYDEVSSGSDYQGFDAPESWITHDDDVIDIPRVDGDTSALGADEINAGGGNVYLGFNPWAPSKIGSGGFSFLGQRSDTEGKVVLIDINGDNLPDKVFEKDGSLWFRLNTSGPNADETAITFGQPQWIGGIGTISKEKAETFSFGPEAYFGLNFMENNAWTWTSETAYFIDVNGDGLVDLAVNGNVLFNQLDPDGVPSFSPVSPVPFEPGTVHTTGISPTVESLYQQLIDEYPLLDTFRRWLAPYDGQIQISGAVRLVEITGPERAEYQTADGVRVAIQHNGNELWSTSIGPDDYEWKTPTNVDLLSVSAGDRIYFRIQSTPDGSSEADGRYDQVEWNPEITYLSISGADLHGNVPATPPQAPGDGSQVGNLAAEREHRQYLPVVLSAASAEDARTTEAPETPAQTLPTRLSSVEVDANLLDPYHYRAAEDFTLAGRRDIQVAMPITGTVRLAGTLEKLGPTSDDISIQAYQGHGTGTRALVFSQKLDWDQSGVFSPTFDLPVDKDDTVQLRVQVDSSIDLAQIEWVPRLFYTAAEGDNPVQDDEGNYIIQLHPPYDIDFYPVNDLGGPQLAWIAPYTGTITATTAVWLLALPWPLPLPPCSLEDDVWIYCVPSGVATFTVKRPGELVAKRAVTITDAVADNGAVTFGVRAGDALYFDYSVYTPQLGELMRRLPFVGLGVYVAYDPATIDPPPSEFPPPPTSFYLDGTLHTTYRPRDPLLGNGLFAQPYRGWSYAGYNGNRARATLPLIESDLRVSEEQLKRYARTQDEFQDKNKRYDGRSEKAYLFIPVPEDMIWRGPDDLAWVGAGMASASRLGEQDYIYVPRRTDGGGGFAVSRQGGTFNAVLGADAGGLLGGSWIADGYNYGDVDFMDMNGDLFPDVLTTGLDPSDLLGQCPPQPVRVQHTAPWGALQTPACVRATEYVRETHIDGWNFNVGANAAKSVGNSQGKQGSTSSQKVTLGLAYYYADTDQESMYDLIDVNGDGLPDRVYQENGSIEVALNLGYTFGPREGWGQARIQTESGHDDNFKPGIGFEYNNYEVAGGLAIPDSKSEVTIMLQDINGDGLPDWIQVDGGALLVALNTGNGFTAPANWWGAQLRSPSRRTVGLGGGLYFTIPVGPLCLVGCYIIINPGGDYTYSVALAHSDLRDVNGDGYSDLVWSNDESWMEVAPNLTGKTNLLRSIQRPLGATIGLDYKREGNTTDMPESRWVLRRVALHDGQPGDGADEQVTTFQYENGIYSRIEREFYGFSTVKEEQLNPGDQGLYRTIRRDFLNDSHYTRGLLKRETVEDANGSVYLETEYTYFLRDADSGNPAAADDLTARIFAELQRVDQSFYEGQGSAQKATYTIYGYDTAYGNLIRLVDAADAGPEDDLEVVIDYFDDPAGRYLVGLPEHTTVRAADSGTVLREQAAELDPQTGALRQVRQYLADGSAAVTDLDYDSYGNIVRLTEPANYKGQRYSLAYSYDDLVHTYVTSIEDSFGYVSTADYDLKYGLVRSSTDVNGNATQYTYDQFGRLETVTGPYQAAGGPNTLRFEYHHDAGVPWALTQRIDLYRDVGDPIETVVFVDGLGRAIQTKGDATVHTGVASSPKDVMIVSGATVFDFVGRPVEQYYPITEDLGSQGVYNPGQDGVPPTVMVYDILDRVTSVTLPDGTVTQYEYGFGADRRGHVQFLSRVTDANGVPKQIYRDVRGLITAVQEFNNGGSQIIWTSYEYDVLGQILRVFDDQENTTEIGYDNLGRRTQIHSPDSGLVETVFDQASNPIQVIPASLRTGDKAIVYDYDYNRPIGITYPDFPENNVTYTYGGPGAAYNRADRVVTIGDESGLEEFFYGPLGEVVKSVKTVASDTLGNSSNSPEVYATEYLYDTWNRLQSLTYPDGEVLTYDYDSAGLLRAAGGSKGGWRYAYIDRLEYDKFGDREFVQVGNGVASTYGYNPLNRCLESIQTGQGIGSGHLFQDLRLTCDNLGNITAEANLAADPSPSKMGGATQYTFQYDDLNRLVHAEGTFDFEPDKQHRYQLEIAYDTLHNISTKIQQHQIREPSGELIEQHETTYAWQYAYGGPQPHASTHLDERTFSYDADGNQAGWEHDRNGTRRVIVWDEESRVQSISDSGHTISYKYNAAGQRVIKRGPQGETVYINPFFTIRDREVGIKHVYANGVRVVSKLMAQDKPGANPKGANPFEKDLYFYHPDHQGTSMYVTNAKGDLYEHLEYFPFGETFVEESSNTQRTPYLFTAKELDEETQLYYFGARYFDPKASQWLSPDPLLDEYLPEGGAEAGLSGMGGVYNSRNLQLYGYAGQNPVTYVDFEGLSFGSAFRGAGRGVAGWLAARRRPTAAEGPTFSVSIPFLTFEYHGKAGQAASPRAEAQRSRFKGYLRRWRVTTVFGEVAAVVKFPQQLLSSEQTRVWYYRQTAREFRRGGKSYRWEGWIIRRLP